jgi:hypothetical protein
MIHGLIVSYGVILVALANQNQGAVCPLGSLHRPSMVHSHCSLQLWVIDPCKAESIVWPGCLQ